MFATALARRAGLGFALAALMAAGALMGPKAASASSGNWCSANAAAFQSATPAAGALACVDLQGSTRTSRTFKPAAFDSARDGLSAINYSLIDQYVNGRWLNTTRWLFRDSLGVNTSTTAAAVTVIRAHGASHYRIRVQACTYDTPTRQYLSCSALRTWTYAW